MADLATLRQSVRSLAPVAALVLSIVLLVVPLRLFQGYLPTPFLPMFVIFLYAVHDPDSLPAPVVFLAGLLHDFLYGPTLGVWSATYLVLQYLTLTQHDYLQGRPGRLVWFAFGVAASIAGIVLYVTRSLLAGGWLPLVPLGYQLFITIAIYPLASMVFFALRNRAAMQIAADDPGRGSEV